MQDGSKPGLTVEMVMSQCLSSSVLSLRGFGDFAC